MKEKHRTIRKDFQEAQLFGPELLNVWEGESITAEQKLNSSSSLNSLVDVIRTSGIRAKIAKRRDEEFPDLDFDSWKRSWNLLKWRALFETIKRRANGDKRILINFNINADEAEPYQERLIFVFLTGQSPFRTETAFSNLRRLASGEELIELLGEFDQLPKLPKPKIFYFDLNRQNE